MVTTINGHKIEAMIGHWGKLLIYIDNILASNGKDKRPGKGTKYWANLLKANPHFDSKCLLPDHFRPDGIKSFDELYKEEK